MARCDLTWRRRRLAACSCTMNQHHRSRERREACDRGGFHTSVIPFLRCLRQRTVHAIRRGFLRWRNSDSDLPFWKRKILLSPRTNSLPCTFPKVSLASSYDQSRLKLYVSNGRPWCHSLAIARNLPSLMPTYLSTKFHGIVAAVSPIALLLRHIALTVVVRRTFPG